MPGEQPIRGDEMTDAVVPADWMDQPFCRRRGCGHSRAIHEGSSCRGTHTRGIPNSSDAFDDPCSCTGFVIEAEDQALALREASERLGVSTDWSPVMTPAMVEKAVQGIEMRRSFMTAVLEKVDGALWKPPGADKPALGKAGAEALLSAFQLRCRVRIIESDLDWTGERHDGEPFFLHIAQARIFWEPVLGQPTLVAEAEGSCNSWEVKYRYRQAERLCPECGKTAIIKGRQEFGGGWVCYEKKGGCKAKFADEDKRLTDQVLGRVNNPDPADQENTIRKMAEKRAEVAATIIATGFSGLVTQDLDDKKDPPAGNGPPADGGPATQPGGLQEIMVLFNAATGRQGNPDRARRAYAALEDAGWNKTDGSVSAWVAKHPEKFASLLAGLRSPSVVPDGSLPDEIPF